MRDSAIFRAAALLAICAAGGTTAAETISYPQTGTDVSVKFGSGASPQSQVGQSITAPAESVLKSFTFTLGDVAGTFSFKGVVAAWTGSQDTGFQITGPLLYQSSIFTVSSENSNQAITVSPNYELTTGQRYILFLNYTSGTGNTTLATNSSNPYSGGTIANADKTDPTVGIWTTGSEVEVAFGATFAAAAPLPGVAVAGLTLLTGLALNRSRRQRV